MKKWLIIAAVVAMFAMVFPACGKDEGGVGTASDVTVTFDDDDAPTQVLITWTATEGYEYRVYYQVIDKLTTIVTTTYISLGQNLYTYEWDDDGGDWVQSLNEEQTQWSLKIPDATFTTIKTAALTADADNGYVRFGVAPANPGGYPIPEKITIAWTEEYFKFKSAE